MPVGNIKLINNPYRVKEIVTSITRDFNLTESILK